MGREKEKNKTHKQFDQLRDHICKCRTYVLHTFISFEQENENYKQLFTLNCSLN